MLFATCTELLSNMYRTSHLCHHLPQMSAVLALEAIETRVVEAVEASAAVAEMLSTSTAPGVEAQPDERRLLELCNQVLTNAKVRS